MAKTKKAVPKKKTAAQTEPDFRVLEKIAGRAIYYSTQMIHVANNREEEKGDPKVGGHPAACSSAAHILGALHLAAKGPFDYLAVKPHASPMDHSYGHLLGMFAHPDGSAFTEDEAKKVMHGLRKFMDPSDPNHEPAFQSYHAVSDPDAFNFFPSGSVGIPPVVSTFTALAYKFAADHGFEVPRDVHFWSLMGDSEFREGSLHECMPDTAERELGNVTWIVDYNRQNLDGTRIKNENDIGGSDADRIERLGRANGWNVIQVRHGRKRLAVFKKVGDDLRQIVERLTDFEVQALLVKSDGATLRRRLIEISSTFKARLKGVSDTELEEALEDLGGHDIRILAEAFQKCRASKKPTLVIAHTIKGWGIPSLKARTGNHSMLADEKEVERLREEQSIPKDDPFRPYPSSSAEGKYLAARGTALRRGREQQRAVKQRNLEQLQARIEEAGGFSTGFGVNLKLAPWANTQWMWGQLASKLNRFANTENESDLTPDERKWVEAAKHVVTLAPDVGTSTNLNPSMDAKVYAPLVGEDFESRYSVKDKRRPDLVPLEKQSHRHLRFEIEEANAMSCMGAFGKMGDHIGVKLLPLMTVYDFFIKRALDQFFYNLYWKSGFILVGTPSGVSLSPEGAQHSWKSDLQIPNGITWEPAFSLEMDWILADAVRRHFTGDNLDREGVLIRAVTRGIEQKPMLERLRAQARFQGMSDDDILEATRRDVLEGGYWLAHFDGAQGYIPGDNVVHLFVMGALAPEALAASDKLLEQGIYANVCVVDSPDLMFGTAARSGDYKHLREGLSVNANLYLNSTQSTPVGSLRVSGLSRTPDGMTKATGGNLEIASRADLLSLRGSRIPIVAVCDGEPGLLDNIGSIVGVPQDTLAVRKHSKSGRPSEVYRYHHLDPDSIAEAAVKMLEQAASEDLIVSTTAVTETIGETQTVEAQPPAESSDPESQTRH